MVPVDDLVLEVESVLISLWKRSSSWEKSFRTLFCKSTGQILWAGGLFRKCTTWGNKPGLHSGSIRVEGSNQKGMQETWWDGRPLYYRGIKWGEKEISFHHLETSNHRFSSLAKPPKVSNCRILNVCRTGNVINRILYNSDVRAWHRYKINVNYTSIKII